MDCYDRDGNKIDMQRFGELLADPRYKILQQTKLGGLLISTVWIGLDMNFMREGPPIIFESMVFSQDEDDPEALGESVACERYATEEEAMEGHHRLVGEYTKLLDVDTTIARLIDSEPDT
jgi:hypothetical protein